MKLFLPVFVAVFFAIFASSPAYATGEGLEILGAGILVVVVATLCAVTFVVYWLIGKLTPMEVRYRPGFYEKRKRATAWIMVALACLPFAIHMGKGLSTYSGI